MAPEHRRAIEAVREGRPIPVVVDGRADLYALGMLLYVALGGSVPKSGEAPTVPLRRRNPRISVGLSDIIDKCLRGDQRDRYPDAAALASDLRRHLGDLPLRGVPNRSWAERWRKWRRRRPSALSRRGLAVLALMAAAGASAATLGIAYRQRLDAAAAALSAGRADIERHRYAEASDALRQGLALIAGLPGFDRQRRGLAEALDRASRARRYDELHGLAEAIRFRYGLAPPPPEDAPALIHLGRKTWEARGALLRGLEGLGEPETDRRVRADLRDLVVLWADLLVRYTSGDERDRATHEAIGILAEAAERLGPNPSLERERRAYAGEIGLTENPVRPSQESRTAWEHYDLGRCYLRSGDADLAAEEFRRGLKFSPQDFWLNFYDGLCAYRLAQFEGAVSAFRVCIALAPGTAECYHNRGLAHQALGDVGAAIDDYDRALELDPGLAEALVNRGILRSRRGDHEAAIADLRRAEGTTTSASLLRIIHDNLEAVRRARGDRAPAADDAPAPPKLDDADRRKSDDPSAPS
jgi:tetratricopeptide (TPR) repeat protein